MLRSGGGSIAVLEDVAWVDRSLEGRLRVRGADRLDLLHRLSTNNLLSLKPFSSCGTVFTSDKGRIVDYVRVLVYPDSLVLLVSSNRVDRLRTWIERYTIMEDIQLEDITSSQTLFSLIGPNNFKSISSILDSPVQPGTFHEREVHGSRLTVDYQEEFGIEWVNVLTPTPEGERSHRLIESLTEHAVQFIGAPMFELYRMTNGVPGEHELTGAFNPYDVNLRHAISYTKGCYIGQEVIARLDTYQKAARGLALLSFQQNIRVSADASIPVLLKGESIGVLTSSSEITLDERHLGLAVLRKSEAEIGRHIVISEGTNNFDAVIERVFDDTHS